MSVFACTIWPTIVCLQNDNSSVISLFVVSFATWNWVDSTVFSVVISNYPIDVQTIVSLWILKLAMSNSKLIFEGRLGYFINQSMSRSNQSYQLK